MGKQRVLTQCGKDISKGSSRDAEPLMESGMEVSEKKAISMLKLIGWAGVSRQRDGEKRAAG